MKKKQVLGISLLAITTILGLASCGGSTGPSKEKDDGYTYRTYLSTSPTNWNVHNWQTSDESYVTSFTEIGLYDCILNDTKDGYKFVTEMASAMPVAIDPDLLDESDYDAIKNKYYEKTEWSKGQVWEIALNKNACWEDGSAIKAKDYVDSMERLLNPSYANFRADSYYNGNLVLANAEAYYKNGRRTIESAYSELQKTTNGDLTNSDGYWYLNLADDNGFVSAVYGDNIGDNSPNFYFFLNNSTFDSDAAEVASQRILGAAAYYMWKYTDHDNSVNKSKWDDFTKPSDASSWTYEEHKNIDIDAFSDKEKPIKTVKVEGTTVTSTSWSDEAYTLDNLKADLGTVVKDLGRGLGNAKASWYWKLPLFANITHEKIDISSDKIGISAVNDYTLRLYLAKTISALDLKFSLTNNWLVNVNLYDKLTISTGNNARATKYATNSAENYISYGPYRLTGFEANSITIEKNEKWYGYTDGNHVDQFKIDRVYTRIIKDHTTAVNEFMAGNLDDIDLTKADMATYGKSGRRTTTYESYTQKISFNTKRSKLVERQSSKLNKTVLANKNFRTGLSLALDRNSFAANATAGSKGFTGLLNDLYIANVATGEMYRNTEEGKSVYNMIYGTLGGQTIYDGTGEATALSESACGYNKNLAIEYLVKGLKEELTSSETGHLEVGDQIDIEFRVYDNESENTLTVVSFITNAWTDVLNSAVNKLKEQNVISSEYYTDESILKLHTQKDEDYYNSAKQGNYDMIFSIWGGAAINPYGLMQVYLDSTFVSTCEYGFKGEQDKENLWIDLNGNGEQDSGEVKTYHAWYKEMDGMTEDDYDELTDATRPAWEAKHKRKLTILAGTEAGIVNRFEAIPLVARGTSSLTGLKFENATKTYINLVGYGGIRFMKPNYNNKEWNNFVTQNNKDLSNIYISYQDND